MTVSDQIKELRDSFERKEEILFDAKHKGNLAPEEFLIEMRSLCEWYVREYTILKEEKCCEGIH